MNSGLLNTLKTTVEFLGRVLGENTEIVLHDLSDYDTSILAISNSLTGRKVGGPLTDFALKILKQSQNSDSDCFINYHGKSADGKSLRSSTMIIRDEHGHPVAMLCINIDISEYQRFKGVLQSLIGPEVTIEEPQKVTETITPSIEELTVSVIERIIGSTSVPPERMTIDEKMEIIRQLNDEGVFLLKGAVKEVASRMKSSEVTIYRYVSKLE